MASFFENLPKIFSGFGRKQASIAAIDFGGSSVKVIQMRKERGRIILETYGEISTGPYAGLAVGQAASLSPDRMAALLVDLFKESNITAQVGAMAIPLRSSLLLTIEIPDLGSSVRLEQVIPIEARKYIPVPITEVALDWWVIPKGRNERDVSPQIDNKGDKLVENNIEVLIAAVHRDLLKQYQDLGPKLNLNLNFFEIETFSTIRSVLKNDLAPKVILDLGATATKMTIVDYGVIRLSHTIGKGGQDVTMAIARSLSVPFAKAEEIKRKIGLSDRLGGEEIAGTVSPTVDYIFSEVNRIMLEYEKKHKRAIDKVILVGAASALQGLPEIASKHLSVPIVRGNPFAKIEAPAFLEPTLAEVGPSFAPAIGLALRQLQDL